MAATAAVASLAVLCGVPLSESARAAEQRPTIAQRQFASPEEAVGALLDAAKKRDQAAMETIFGSKYDELLTGDKVEDSTDLVEFTTALSQMCNPAHQGDDTIVLNIGAENWPFPIPLVKSGGQWYYNTAAGKEEIINRHVGEDELNTIGVCRAYVQAQRDYFRMDRDGNGVQEYARRFRSSEGKRDGLYWEPKEGEALSPFGPLVAEAQAEGYTSKPLSKTRRPFHGYFFKILTRQGPAASGGAYDYIINGNMVAGFALIAYPAQWGESGIMSFIVSRQGTVYQRNLGPETLRIAGAMTEFNPDAGWTPVTEHTTAK